jgi:phosphoribosylaminoimidazole carboxylase PurE protein
VLYEARALSAHRTPELLVEWVGALEKRGAQCFRCGRRRRAHLAGVVAAQTLVPVLAVADSVEAPAGLDSLLSMVQMPKGIPVATFAIGDAGSANAGLFRGRDAGACTTLRSRKSCGRFARSRRRRSKRQSCPSFVSCRRRSVFLITLSHHHGQYRLLESHLSSLGFCIGARCATFTRSATTSCSSVQTDRLSAFDVILPTRFRAKAGC